MINRTLRHRRPDKPRLLAHRILGAVTTQGAYANLETGRILTGAGLDERDAAFVTELVAGTCRLWGTYDRIIMAASGRDTFDPALFDALRLGVHQLLSMRVGHHAAISTTVDLAAATVGEKVAGLTNAVLRKVAARDLHAWVELLGRNEDAAGRMALRTHHPRWIVEAYLDLLGEEAEQALMANNVAPLPTLVVRPGLASVAELGGEPTTRSAFGARRAGNPGDVAAVREGRAGVQDEGSQLAALALADAPAPGGPWLDLCAGPGGKAALLGGLAIEQGTTLLASELQTHRAELVSQSLRAYSGPWRPIVIAADGTRPAWPAETFAKVMADVPCTGLGALRRRPESRWRRTPEDLVGLVPLQRRLLTSAIESTRPGGVVAYVTCSPHRHETTGVVDSVLEQRTDTVVEATNQLWPHRHGTDAMFYALLRRVPR